MNKTELIAAVAERAELSKKDAESAVTAAIDVITEALRQEEKVQLVGFGSFEVKSRAERMGRNPQTKEPHTIPALTAPVFPARHAPHARCCPLFRSGMSGDAAARRRLFVLEGAR